MTDTSQPTPPVYATFVGEINQASVKPLVGAIAAVSQSGAPHLHLMLQSTGGTVSEGVYLHNFIRALPLPLTIYNGGAVCSAAVMAFLGCKDRQTSENAAFMIHRCQASPQGANAAHMAAAIDSLAIDDTRMDGILKNHLTLSEEKWAQYDHHFVWIGAREAVAAGLATAIGDFAPPLGSPVYAFG